MGTLASGDGLLIVDFKRRPLTATLLPRAGEGKPGLGSLAVVHTGEVELAGMSTSVNPLAGDTDSAGRAGFPDIIEDAVVDDDSVVSVLVLLTSKLVFIFSFRSQPYAEKPALRLITCEGYVSHVKKITNEISLVTCDSNPCLSVSFAFCDL